MKEFRYLGYHTVFSCDGDVNVKMNSYACFAPAFKYLGNIKKSSVHYIIKIYKGTALQRRNLSNMCFFDRKHIKNHINQLKDLFSIESKVYDGVDTEFPYFVVELDIKNASGLCHKYALTWVRYLYEYPYNMILGDAYRLKEDPLFRFESIANLFNLISRCVPVYVGDGHGVVGNSGVGFLKRRELSARLNKEAKLNSIYTRINIVRTEIPDEIGQYTSYDIEYWESRELFEETRKPIYIKEYLKQRNR